MKELGPYFDSKILRERLKGPKRLVYRALSKLDISYYVLSTNILILYNYIISKILKYFFKIAWL